VAYLHGYLCDCNIIFFKYHFPFGTVIENTYTECKKLENLTSGAFWLSPPLYCSLSAIIQKHVKQLKPCRDAKRQYRSFHMILTSAGIIENDICKRG
jgi:hypothetical protein